MHQWDRLLDRFMEEYKAAGRADGTIKNVQRELERFGNWLKSRRPKPTLESVNHQLIQDYLKARTTFKAKSTHCGVMGTLRTFGEFLVREGEWLENPLRWMRGPKLDRRHRLPRRVSQQQLIKLMETAADSRTDYQRILLVTLLAVFYGTGPRRSEVVNLNLSDFDPEQSTLQFDGRKTRHERLVAIPPLVKQCLLSYLPKRQNRLEASGQLQEKALFVNKDGSRLKGAAISRAMNHLCKRSKCKVTLHQYRHTCASDLLENGVNLPQVQRVLGHQCLETTMRYLHIADRQLHQAAEKHPVNLLLSHEGVTHE